MAMRSTETDTDPSPLSGRGRAKARRQDDLLREAARRLKESGDTAKFSKKRHDGRQKGLQTSN